MLQLGFSLIVSCGSGLSISNYSMKLITNSVPLTFFPSNVQIAVLLKKNILQKYFSKTFSFETMDYDS